MSQNQLKVLNLEVLGEIKDLKVNIFILLTKKGIFKFAFTSVVVMSIINLIQILINIKLN